MRFFAPLFFFISLFSFVPVIAAADAFGVSGVGGGRVVAAASDVSGVGGGRVVAAASDVSGVGGGRVVAAASDVSGVGGGRVVAAASDVSGVGGGRVVAAASDVSGVGGGRVVAAVSDVASDRTSVGVRRRGDVILGDERFDVYLPMLKGARVAIFSNHTGIVGDVVRGSKLADDVVLNGLTDESSLIPFLEPSKSGCAIEYGPHILDALIVRGVNVTAVFSPEHGFRGSADPGELVGSGVDEKTGVEILSLYENGSGVPGKEKMDKFDILVVDIQDVGLRYYTYYITMHHLMDSCAEYGKKVIILDRPNPNGFYVDGPLLDPKFKSGIGSLPVAMVHGMTLGELALMINGEGWLSGGSKCDLEVVPCLGYTHRMKCPLILPPSPNLKDMKSVFLYSSTCFFEGTVVTPGRGTQFPFEVYGHPDLKGRSFIFTPESIPGAKNPRFLGQECCGVDLRNKPLEEIWKEKINLDYIIDAYSAMDCGDSFFGTNDHFELLIGVGWVRQMIESGKSSDVISACWSADVQSFKDRRRQYLLYPE